MKKPEISSGFKCYLVFGGLFGNTFFEFLQTFFQRIEQSAGFFFVFDFVFDRLDILKDILEFFVTTNRDRMNRSVYFFDRKKSVKMEEVL